VSEFRYSTIFLDRLRRAAVLASTLPLTAQTPQVDSPDATAFASIAEREVSQLHEGITLAQWMDARGKSEHWVPKKPEIELTGSGQECLSLLRTEPLPSGARITQAVYFYPPLASSPAAFPTSSGQDLINNCVLGMVRMEGDAPTPEAGHVWDQAAWQQLTKQYGESIGMKRVPFWGRSYNKDGRSLDPRCRNCCRVRLRARTQVRCRRPTGPRVHCFRAALIDYFSEHFNPDPRQERMQGAAGN